MTRPVTATPSRPSVSRRVFERGASRRAVVTSVPLALVLARRAPSRASNARDDDDEDDDDDDFFPPPSTPGANAYAPTRAVDGARTRFLVSASAPEPVMFPRPTIALAFAVCLLRSSYEAVDECDVLAMDTFQATSWKFRQSEWEPYKYLYEPLKIEQGAIADPLYFDFATFVQTATVGRAIPKSTSVFEERVGAEGTPRIVRRDESLRDNDALPEAIAERCGKKIYERLVNGFDRGEDFQVEYFPGAPKPVSRDARGTQRLDEAIGGMRAIAEVFVDNGYALRISVDNDLRASNRPENADVSRRVRVRVNGPATLWGARELINRGIVTTNEFLGFTLTAYLAESGISSAYTERVTDTEIDMSFSLSL